MKCVLFLISLVLVVYVDALVNLELGSYSNSPKIYPTTANFFRHSPDFPTYRCTNICFYKGRKYAAVLKDHIGGVCVCFDELQHETKTSTLDVNIAKVFLTYYIGGEEGCYQYNRHIYIQKYVHIKNSPSYCIADCKNAGYKYAGLLNNVCACSNTINQSELSDGKCNRKCSGASGIPCGGYIDAQTYVTVYPVV